MSLMVRRADERGRGQYGWLDARYSFSFARYFDPRFTGFRALRVLNEDRVAPGRGFPDHPHEDMEILTYIVSGALAHRDSTGRHGVIRPGDVQHMSAGSGIEHSEFNASDSEPVHLLQVWIEPARRGLAPAYDQRTFPESERRGQLRLVASPDGADASLRINQDARMLAALLDPGDAAEHPLAPGRHAWVQVVRGRVTVNTVELREGDGAAVSDEPALRVEALDAAELVAFDLA